MAFAIHQYESVIFAHVPPALNPLPPPSSSLPSGLSVR